MAGLSSIFWTSSDPANTGFREGDPFRSAASSTICQKTLKACDEGWTLLPAGVPLEQQKCYKRFDRQQISLGAGLCSEHDAKLPLPYNDQDLANLKLVAIKLGIPIAEGTGFLFLFIIRDSVDCRL